MGLSGYFKQEFLEFSIRHLRLRLVAVGFCHQAEMRHAHAVLRFRGLRGCGEKGDEILIFRFRLGQSGNSALVVVGIRNRQLGFGKILAIRVGVDEGLQGQPSYFVSRVGNFVGRFLVKNFVRLLAGGKYQARVGVVHPINRRATGKECNGKPQ